MISDLLTPTRFADWYANVTNQGAHGGVAGRAGPERVEA